MRWEFVCAHCRSQAVLSCAFLVCRWSSVGLTRPAPPSTKGRDLAVFPLAVPAIAGPGAITAIILLTDNDVFSVPQRAETGVVLLVVLALNYILLLLSDAILRIIGQQGAAVLTRVMGIILTALSVEFVLTGLSIGNWAKPLH